MDTRLCIVAIFLTGACTPVQWVRSDASEEQSGHDARFCEQEASREAAFHVPQPPPTGAMGTYGPSADGLRGYGIETSRLTGFCMRSKGYALVPSREYARASEDAPRSAAGSTSAPK
jgi:hypothetical protein